jgi:hypothetical protein
LALALLLRRRPPRGFRRPSPALVLVSAAFLWLGAPQQRSPARELPPPSTPEGDAGQPAAGSFWWWGTRKDRLERAGRAVERQTALAHERKSRAAHDEARARRRLRETVVRHLASAQALLRLDEAKAALADGQAALARRLNAATAMLRRQAWEGSAGQQDSARARLLAAEVCGPGSRHGSGSCAWPPSGTGRRASSGRWPRRSRCAGSSWTVRPRGGTTARRLGGRPSSPGRNGTGGARRWRER